MSVEEVMRSCCGTKQYQYHADDCAASRAQQELMRIEKWDRRFLELAKMVSTWSKDPSTQVGAVIVNNERIVLGMGYNGFARGVEDTEERYNDRPTKYAFVVHAEANAILNAGHAAKGATIYVYPAFGKPPLCGSCAKLVIQAGITRVVGYIPDIDDETAARWKPELDIALAMCSEAGILMDMLPQ
jgi:dCMP deaminase